MKLSSIGGYMRSFWSYFRDHNLFGLPRPIGETDLFLRYPCVVPLSGVSLLTKIDTYLLTYCHVEWLRIYLRICKFGYLLPYQPSLHVHMYVCRQGVLVEDPSLHYTTDSGTAVCPPCPVPPRTKAQHDLMGFPP